jgi:hypothetical protein
MTELLNAACVDGKMAMQVLLAAKAPSPSSAAGRFAGGI